MPDNRPIGVFDSGVGGLTVLQALHDALPDESTTYLGDLARCPYGPRPQDEVRGYAIQIGDLLAQENIKLLVVACNTATAAAYDVLLARYPFPVVGVIEPGARAAAEKTRNGRVGVIATDGTTASGAYRDALLSVQPGLFVMERSASWLVPLIERGFPARGAVEARLMPVLSEFSRQHIDTLILGCTHFPLAGDIFSAGVGEGISVVDSATTTAARVRELLQAFGIEADGIPQHRLLVTGPAEAFAERTRAMFRVSPAIETVDPLALVG